MISPFLSECPEGLTIKDLAEKTGLHRNILTKYLKILQAQGKIDLIEIGTARYIRKSNRIPASVFQINQSEPVLILDQHCTIITQNRAATDLIQNADGMIGFPLTNKDNIRHIFGDELLKGLIDAVRGISSEFIVQMPSESKYFAHDRLNQCIPVVLDDGSPGAALRITNKQETMDTQGYEQKIHAFQALLPEQIQFMARFSEKGMITFMNQPFARHLENYSDPDQTHRYPRFMPRFPDDEYTSFLESLATIHSVQDLIQADITRFLADGEECIERWNIRGWFDEGKLVEYHATGIDITSLICRNAGSDHRDRGHFPEKRDHSDTNYSGTATISLIQSSMYQYRSLWPRI